ncbi:SseB family protein [Arcanobacterium phocae]|uniref:SseB protein N-terminal domain-containing protein n=1 Tax=Arcanobacterium phocae TaxID=131112 RepID=A0A1H2LIB0_9ACTO|nr:SseB family protein [Arcanobacterium phocae]SDU80649.1 SseB protein N-terminal domain-containing protein [Arcanobacterium phocae]
MPDIASLLAPNPFSNDDGSVPPELAKAFTLSVADGRAEAVVASLTRVLLPVVPHEHPGLDESGRVKEHQSYSAQPLAGDGSLVTAELAGQRPAVVVFSGIDALRQWHKGARPVPATVESVAIASLKQQTGLMVLDPGSTTETWLGRTAVIALASGGRWLAPWNDERINDCVATVAREVASGIVHMSIEPGPAGFCIVDIGFPADSQMSDVMRVATYVSEALESDPYVRARLDVVEIRPRIC